MVNGKPYKMLNIPRSVSINESGYYDLTYYPNGIAVTKRLRHNSSPNCYYLFDYELPAIFMGSTVLNTIIFSLKSNFTYIKSYFNLSQDEINDIEKELKEVKNLVPNGNSFGGPYNQVRGFDANEPLFIKPEYQEPVKTKHKCHCDFTMLLREGCRCGGI